MKKPIISDINDEELDDDSEEISAYMSMQLKGEDMAELSSRTNQLARWFSENRPLF